MNFAALTRIAEEVSHNVVSALPAEVRACVEETPVFFERIPAAEDVKSGIEPDTLGLFDPGDELPTPRIRLWLENIWDEAGEDTDTFREEVEITLLHEIGHLLGWNEDQIEERGLE